MTAKRHRVTAEQRRNIQALQDIETYLKVQRLLFPEDMAYPEPTSADKHVLALHLAQAEKDYWDTCAETFLNQAKEL